MDSRYLGEVLDVVLDLFLKHKVITEAQDNLIRNDMTLDNVSLAYK